MSDFETRRRRAAIRPGHVVTKKDGRRIKVFHIYDFSFSKEVSLEPLDGYEEHEGDSESRNNLFLDSSQITEEDEQEMVRREQHRRAEFAGKLSPLLQTYTLDRVEVHEGNREAFEACRDLEHGTTLFIHGHPGNGKTMLAVAAAQRFAPYYSVKFWSVVELFSAIRASFSPHAHVERPNLQTPELLVLDDIGKTRASDFIYEELYRIINYRLERHLTTIFTSNHSVFDTATKVSPDPDNMAALVSRLASGSVVTVTGPDRRILRGKGG